MKMKDFNNEFKLTFDGDHWGCCMDAWFESVGQLNKRGMEIPEKYQYRSGLGDGTNEDSYWYELFETSTNEELYAIAELMFRYAQFIERAGKDY